MPPIKSEPLENSPEMDSGDPEYALDIKSETTGYPAGVKSETVEYTPEISPAKRLKTLNPISSSPSSKGKSKIEKEDDDDDDAEQQLGTCGVCLLDEGMSLRGFVDSCEHYFCFVCIMEWAKVESRCPICKRRFSTIRRPSKHGIFLSERIVKVPVRDQVYFHDGNATIGPADPYSQVKCSICSLATDENLLLLCDLCDSAAHSYCAGLGATVPEGDWFCHDCTLSRDEHAKIETDANSDNQTCFPSSQIAQTTTNSHVSIFDIVRDSCSREQDRSSGVANFNRDEPSVPQSIVGHTSNVSNARTLQRCLTVHARIKVLRENWDSFRGGSLRFSSGFGDAFKAGQGQSSSTSQKDPCTNVSPNRGAYNVDRAWRMMDIASKAIGRKSGKKSSVDKNSKHPVMKERLLKEANKARLKPLIPDGKRFGDSKQHFSVGTSKKIGDKSRFQTFEKDKAKHGDVNGCTVASSRKVITSAQGNNYRGNRESLSRENTLGGRSNVVGSSDGSSHLVRSPLIAAQKCRVREEVATTSEERGGMNNALLLDKNNGKMEDAKIEIQSLVKLNLKLLTRHKKLEADVFKRVARHATHSILAACGFESPKSGFRSFPRLVCTHVDGTQKRPRSTLMTTSCRECFFVFVKDVVNTVSFDTTISSKA